MPYKYKNFLKLFIILLTLYPLFSSRALAQSAQNKNTWAYPRVANYFLDSYLHPDESKLLVPWDVLILSAAAQVWQPAALQTIKAANPDAIILAYISVSGISDTPTEFEIFKPFDASNIPDNWWLKSSTGEKISYWPGAHMVNPTNMSPAAEFGLRWNDWLAGWIADNIHATGYWDGIFLDEAFPVVSWLNGGDIDLNGDGKREDAKTIDTAWQSGVEKITKNLRDRLGPNAYIMVNGASNYTTYTNGRMHESAFHNTANWSSEMNNYINTHNASGFQPRLTVINANTANTGYIDDRQTLFAFTSTLLGDGFFSYDFGDQQHLNIWWLKEYDKYLGQPLGSAQNITGPSDQGFVPGLWRRNFTNGVVLVNATDRTLDYDINLNGKITQGQLDAYSGNIVTLDEFTVNENRAPEPLPKSNKATEAQPVELMPGPDLQRKISLQATPKTEPDTQQLYQDKPLSNVAHLNNTTTGNDIEIEVKQAAEQNDSKLTAKILTFIKKVAAVLDDLRGNITNFFKKI